MNLLKVESDAFGGCLFHVEWNRQKSKGWVRTTHGMYVRKKPEIRWQWDICFRTKSYYLFFSHKPLERKWIRAEFGKGYEAAWAELDE